MEIDVPWAAALALNACKEAHQPMGWPAAFAWFAVIAAMAGLPAFYIWCTTVRKR